MIRQVLLTLAAIVVIRELAMPQEAHAYLDPGSGSMLFQILIAGIVSALLTVKLWWLRAKSFVLRLFSFGRTNATEDENDEAQPKTE